MARLHKVLDVVGVARPVPLFHHFLLHELDWRMLACKDIFVVVLEPRLSERWRQQEEVFVVLGMAVHDAVGVLVDAKASLLQVVLHHRREHLQQVLVHAMLQNEAYVDAVGVRLLSLEQLLGIKHNVDVLLIAQQQVELVWSLFRHSHCL